MNPFVKRLIEGLIRHGLTIMASVLTSKGMVTEDMQETIIGMSGVIVSVLWSIYDKYHSEKKLGAALALPAGSTKADASVAARTDAAPPVMLSANSSVRPIHS